MNDKAVAQRDNAPAPPAAMTPTDMLAIAVQQDANLEKLEKLMELERQWKADKAREAFVRAMSKFRGEAVEIVKSRQVRYETSKGLTEYRHADLADAVNAAVPALSKHGLSHRWKTEQGEGGRITVTCVITHELGHSEETALAASPDDSGGKNSIQAIGSTITYLERYTFLALTGLAAKGQDDDAEAAEAHYETITAEQLADLEALIDEVGADKDSFTRFCKVEDLADMPASKYDAACIALRTRKREDDNE